MQRRSCVLLKKSEVYEYMSESKEKLRERYIAMREELPEDEVVSTSLDVQSTFISSYLFQEAKRIALYVSAKNEILTGLIFTRAIEEGKEVFFPKVVEGEPFLKFFKVESKDDLSPGAHGILEPSGESEEASLGDGSFGCVVVPGNVFDMRGVRIGYGKGYYDRVLAKDKCPKVALAYVFQMLDNREDGFLPVEDHDVLIDCIFTESGEFELIQGSI